MAVSGQISLATHRLSVITWPIHPTSATPSSPQHLAGALTAVVRNNLTRRDREPPAAVAASFARHTEAMLHTAPLNTARS